MDEVALLEASVYPILPRLRDVEVNDGSDLDVYSGDVNPDMDSLEYNNNVPEWNFGYLEENKELAMWGMIAIGSGLGVIVLIDLILAILNPAWFNITGMILALLGLGGWVWGFLKWQDSENDPTKWTTFRSWKINYLFYWVDVAIGGLVFIFTFVSFFVAIPTTGGVSG